MWGSVYEVLTCLRCLGFLWHRYDVRTATDSEISHFCEVCGLIECKNDVCLVSTKENLFNSITKPDVEHDFVSNEPVPLNSHTCNNMYSIIVGLSISTFEMV